MPAPAQTSSRQPDLNEGQAPPLTVRAVVSPSTIDVEARTVEVTWSTGADVQRRDFWTGERFVESLSLDPKHVRMGRLQQGAPLLDSHSAYRLSSVLGVVDRASIEGGKGRATIRFSRRAEVDGVWQDVVDRVLRSVSVGYLVHKWETKRDAEGKLERRTAIDWEPHEISLVPIPADVGAQTRALSDDSRPAATTKGTEMSAPANNANRAAEAPEVPPAAEAPETPATDGGTRAAPVETAPAPAPAVPAAADATQIRAEERRRVSEIDELAQRHGIDAQTRRRWIDEGASVPSVRAAILDHLHERSAAGHVNPVMPGDGRREGDMRRDMANALLVRAGGVDVEGDGHRNFGDGNLGDMARRALEAAGVNTRTLNRNDLATRAMTTGDFLSVLALVGEKLVRGGYDAMPMAHRTAFRRTSASDFKAKHRPVTSAGQPLEKVPESGVIPRRDGKVEVASYAVDTYAGIIPISRKLIINDDFDLFASLSRQRGRAAAETERRIVWDMIKSNPVAPDGTALFGTRAGLDNFAAAAAGATVGVDEIKAARAAVRKAKAPDGNTVGGAIRYLVCGPDTESDWEVLLSDRYMPTDPSGAVPATLRSLMLLVDPEITDESWYAFTDPNQVDTIEYAYLAGSQGPRLEQRVGFDVEGVELKVGLDFGAGVIDHRGAYRMAQS